MAKVSKIAQAVNKALKQAIPLGISDWNRLIKGNKLVVDKTAKLWDLVSDYDKVFISRPRRMGKTTACSMLYELFAHGRDSFKDKAIYELWTEQTYPVIRLSFNEIKGDLEMKLKSALVNAFSKAGFPEVEQFDRSDVLSGFLGKFDRIAEHHSLVILIDEWDYPLSHNLDNEYEFNLVKEGLSDFYSWLRNVPNLRFVFITGIMRYREVSLFSGQDIQDLSMVPEYADLFGYTQEEVEYYFDGYIDRAAQYLQLTRKELLEQLALRYDGFCFDEDASVKVYCPYSINKFFFPVYKGKKPHFGNYWMVSANASTALVSYLYGHDLDLETIRQICKQQFTLSYQEICDATFFGTVSFQQLLLQAGYFSLMAIDAESQDELDPENRSYICSVTNQEVSKEFFPVFNRYLAGFELARERKLEKANRKAQRSLLVGNIAQMCIGLNMVLSDIGYEILQKADELLYGYFFEQALVSSRKMVVVREKRNNGGRSDLVATTKDRVYAIELKRFRLKSNTDSAKRALLDLGDKQIFSRFYGNNFLYEGKPVTGVVLVVCDKYRQICAWRTIEQTDKGIQRKEGMVPPLSIATQHLVNPKASKAAKTSQKLSATKAPLAPKAAKTSQKSSATKAPQAPRATKGSKK